MLTPALVSRFSFPSHVVDACNAVGMSDADVWRDVCQVAGIVPAGWLAPADALLAHCLDGATAEMVPTWQSYVDALKAYVATDRMILRPLADLDDQARNDTELPSIVDVDENPAFDTPAWCEGVDTIGRAADTARHGAGAMALPCCFYGPAVATMSRHGDEALEYINDAGCVDALTLNPASQDWHGFASHVLTVAVELWCGQFPDLDTADLYVVAREAGVK